MSEQYKDRFSNAEEEQQEKSAFVCESCNKKYTDKEAKDKMMNCCGRTLTGLLQEGFGP